MTNQSVRLYERYPKFLRFCMAGAVGFFIDGGIVQILATLTGLNPLLSRLISFSFAVTATWQLNRKLTFPEARPEAPWRQWLRYVTANAIGAMANLVTYAILVLNSAFCARWPVIAVLAGSVVGLALNFTLSAKFVFLAEGPQGPRQFH